MTFSPPSSWLRSILWRSGQILRAHLLRFWGIQFLIGLPILLLQLALPGLMRSRIGVIPWSSTIGGVLLVWLTLVLVPLGTVVLVRLVVDQIAVQPTTNQRPASPLTQDLLRTIGTIVRYGTVIFVGLCLGLIPGIIAAIWFVFIPQILVVEQMTGQQAFKRSRSISRQTWRTISGLFLLFAASWLAIIGAMLGFAELFPGIETGIPGTGAPFILNYPNYAIQTLLTYLLNSLLYTYGSVCFTLLYMNHPTNGSA